MSVIEKLVDAMALIESALDEMGATRATPPSEEPSDCKHENSQEVTGAGKTRRRFACLDCCLTWGVDDAN